MPRHEIERSKNPRPKVGRYELGRILHDGAFAKVKYGRDIETGRSVAIKILSKDTIFKHKLVDQIKRDISTMKLLKHPNVVQLYEVIASKSKIYVVLEYVAGGELFKEIALKGRFKETRARKYFQQLINAVDYCHSRGIYHRDLKPENLLLDSHGNLKISDFGLSAVPQQLGEDGLLHTTCGTPNYVAPEVFLCKGYDGAKADIWSCGVILFVLMAGYLPFEDSNLVDLYKKINKGEFKCPPWFSPDACKLLRKMLNPNRELRATIPSIIQDPWFKKDYSMPSFEEDSDIPFDDVDAVLNESMERFVLNKDEMRQPRQPVHLNAFELIALSNELDLSRFFGKKQDLKHELHFTSRHPASEIISRMEETAIPLGFNVLKHDYKMKLQGAEMGRMGHLSVAAEVFEVAPSLFMVEVRKACGDSSEYHRFYQNLSKGLKDIVWKNEGDLLG